MTNQTFLSLTKYYQTILKNYLYLIKYYITKNYPWFHKTFLCQMEILREFLWNPDKINKLYELTLMKVIKPEKILNKKI